MAAELRDQVVKVADWLERMGIAFLPYQERVCAAILAKQMEPTPTQSVPRSWHEAWLDTADARGRVDVIVPEIGRAHV